MTTPPLGKGRRMNYDEILCHHIDRAAARLDVLVPKWAQRIDLERLDLNDSQDCILGQVFGYRWRRWFYTYARAKRHMPYVRDGAFIGGRSSPQHSRWRAHVMQRCAA